MHGIGVYAGPDRSPDVPWGEPKRAASQADVAPGPSPSDQYGSGAYAPNSQAPASFRGPKYRQSVCPRPKPNG
jgi:hypothetical protein